MLEGAPDLFPEDSLQPVSALQHLVFCERRCALIHLECVWEENAFTTEGEILHENVHNPAASATPGLRRVTAMPVRSLRLGLIGQCDLVEFSPSADGRETPYPVEFKRGTPGRGECDEIQLCAQAFCLEEMLNVAVPAGAVFYAAIRRRREILFTPGLRSRTLAAISRLHQLLNSGRTPLHPFEKKCDSCSLIEHCRPQFLLAAAESCLRSLFHPES
jgi:CRISPR-associated exonuclease Cas4